MKAYIYGVMLLVATVLVLGVVAPTLISWDDTFLVTLGFVALAVYFPLMFKLGKAFLEELNKELNKLK